LRQMDSWCDAVSENFVTDSYRWDMLRVWLVWKYVKWIPYV
jgi:hypothetical protein